MKIIAFAQAERTMIGAVDADGNVSALDELEAFWRDPSRKRTAKAAGALRDLDERPALPARAKVVCVGLNYRLHAQETGSPIPTTPVIFSRWASTLTTDGRPAPQIEDKFDYEAELAVIIGKPMFRVSADKALDGVFGYAAFNDLSARTFQTQTPQWIMGKNSPSSGPMSAIVTRDEAGDPAKGLRISARLNGNVVQDSTTADMIFDVDQLVAHISQAVALEPGDLIITGTPSGVGMATGRFLKAGDEIVVEVESIGTVRTPIVSVADYLSQARS